MAAPQPWVLRQLSGGKRELRLEGYAAPFGRPRKGEVANETISVRQQTTRYPGTLGVTRHTFGTSYEPMRLHGRWSDSTLGGPGSAKNKSLEAKTFIKDQIDCDITWGGTVTLVGFLAQLDLLWESEAECVWSMEIDVDNDRDESPIALRPAKPPHDYTNRFREIFEAIEEAAAQEPLKVPIQDALGLLVGALLQPLADLEAIVNDLKSFKDGTLGQLRKLRSGLTMFRRALNTFRDTFETLPAELALEAQITADEINLLTSQASTSALIVEAFAQSAEADRQARNAQASSIKAIFTAKEGDTWEQLSITIYGDASRAGDLRSSNDAGTENPVPGELYIAAK